MFVYICIFILYLLLIQFVDTLFIILFIFLFVIYKFHLIQLKCNNNKTNLEFESVCVYYLVFAKLC